MDRKWISVFFSALICSTLGHEYLKAHEISHAGRLESRHAKNGGSGGPEQELKHERRNHHNDNHKIESRNHNNHNEFRNAIHKNRHNLGPAQFRDSSDVLVCSYTCPVPAPVPDNDKEDFLNLLRVDEIDAFAILNRTVNVAVVFGLTSALILNGGTGTMIWLDLKTDSGIHFKPETRVGWVRADGIGLNEFLLKLGSLENVKDLEGGNKFSIKTAPHYVSIEASIILKDLAPSLSLKLDKNPKASLPIFLVLTETLAEQNETVTPILQKMETRKIVISGELTTVASALTGLGLLDRRLKGNLGELVTGDFSTSLLLSLRSGLEMFAYLLVQAGDKVDVAKVLGDIISNPEVLFEVLVELDGGFYTGIAGITAIIHNIQLYVAKKISLEALVDVFLQGAAENTQKITRERWQNIQITILGVIKLQTDKFNSQDKLSTVTTFFNDIKDNKLMIGKIDVSAIINILIEASGQAGQSSFSAIIKVLLLLDVVVSATLIITILLLRLIWFVVSGEGIIYILKLLPKLKIEIDFSSTTSVIKQILSKVQLWKLTTAIARLDVVGIITQLPVIGEIYRSVETGIKESGNPNLNLGKSLKDSGVVTGVIKEWVWYGLGLSGGKQPSGGGIAGSSFVGGGVSTSWNAKYTSTVVWTQKGGSIVPDASSSGGGSSGGSGGSSAGGSGGSSAGGSGGSSAGGSGGSSAGGSGGSSAGGSGGSSAGGSGGSSAGGSGGSSVGGSGSAGGSRGWSWSWGSKGVSSGSDSSSGGSSGSGGSGGSALGGGSSNGKGGKSWGFGWGR